MPTDTLEAPANAAADVSTIAPSRAVENRDARNPTDRQTAQRERSKAARDQANAIARDMAAKKFLLGDDKAAPDASVAPAKEPVTREPKATPAPKAEDAPAAEPTAEQKAAATEKSKKLGNAKRALALDGWKPERIGKMTEDEILEIGEHRAKNQADVNREFAKLRNASSPTGARAEDGTFAPKAAEDKPAPTPAAKETPAPAAVHQDDPEIAALIEAAQDEIGEPATKLFKAVVAKLESKVRRQSEIGTAVTTEILYSQGRQLIETEYPDKLNDPAAFDEVAENFRALVSSGRYGRGQVSKAWREAGFMAFGAPDTVQQAQREMLARQTAADIGRVDPGRGDTGTHSQAASAVKGGKEALQLAAKMFASNPSAKLDDLQGKLMAKLKGGK